MAQKYYSYEEDSVLFWKDQYKIEKYCNTILNYFNQKNKIVKIIFNNTTYPAVEGKYKPYTEEGYAYKFYDITLPEFDTFFLTDREKKLHIHSRIIFLKHELAHVIFSNLSRFSSIDNNKYVFNRIEDARVEELFCQKLKGNRSLFLRYAWNDYLNKKEAIENEDFNINNLADYIYFRIKNFPIYVWNKTESINSYTDIYNNIEKDIFADEDKYFSMLNFLPSNEKIFSELKNNFTSFKPSLLNKNEEEEEYEHVPEEILNNKDLSPLDQSCDTYSTEKEMDITNIYFNEDEDDDNLTIADELSNVSTSGNIEFDSILNTLNKIQDNKILSISDINKCKITPNEVDDALMINLPKFAEITQGIVLFQKNGINYYKKVVNENKKIISESIRFLTLKLQNRKEIKIKRLLTDGMIDEENITEIILNKEEPKAFLKNIRNINPESNIHVLIDISDSMSVWNIKMCIINAIILMEIARSLKIKYTFQMFTNVSSKFYKIRSRKNPFTVAHMLNLFKGSENKVYVALQEGYKTSLLLSELMYDPQQRKKRVYGYNLVTKSIYGNVPVIYYIKDVDEEISNYHANMLGNLYSHVNAIKTHFSNGTPEFQCVAQVVKMYQNKNNARNILFLINDGAYDTSFKERSSLIKFSNFVNQVYFDSMFLLPNNLDLLSLKIQQINMFKDMLNDNDELIQYIMYMKQHTDDKIWDNEYKISIIINQIINEILFVINDIINKKSFNYYSKYIITATYRNKTSYDLTKYIKEKYNDSDNDLIIKQLITNINNLYYNYFSINNIIYKKLIQNIRNQGWKVIGAGIRSESGLRYIGYGNFTSFKNEEDIKENFGKKLRKIF